MHEGFVQALVGFLQFDVLAHDADGDLALGAFFEVDHELAPAVEMGAAGGQGEEHGHLEVEAFIVELERHFVHVLHVHGSEHSVLIHVAEEGELLLEVGRQRLFTAAEDDVGLDADGKEGLGAVLGGLGLVLAGGLDVRNVGKVDVQAVLAAELGAELADGFEEGQAFDVANGAADLHKGYVRGVFGFTDAEESVFDLVGDVGDDLDGAALVFAAAFLVEDAPVDAAGSDGVQLGEGNVQVAFVVTEVEVGFGAVVSDEHFAVLERVQRAGVDIKVGVELLHGHRKAASFQQSTEGGNGKALAKGGKDAAGDEDKFGFHV